MMALWLDGGAAATRLERVPLGGGHDEAWLQRLLFDHPELVPMDRIEPGSGGMVPLRRELPLPKPGGTVFLDVLGITRHGRPVLVECKLWRNPQARREVVAQILEYAALLRRWTYADLLTQLAPVLGPGPNPLWERVRHHGGTLAEADFVDAVSRALRGGDFHLVIAGDGIREDLAAIADHLREGGARLALVEVQLWEDGAGRTLVVPSLPLRTEVVRHRVFVDAAGIPLRMVDEADAGEAVEKVAHPGRAAERDGNRAFWQRFIDGATFSHPDQLPPRHGGNNWVKLPLPEPARSLTMYRTKADGEVTLGAFLAAGDASDPLRRLAWDAEALKRETSLADLELNGAEAPSRPVLTLRHLVAGVDDEDAQLAWLWDAADRLVTALRPRLAVMAST